MMKGHKTPNIPLAIYRLFIHKMKYKTKNITELE